MEVKSAGTLRLRGSRVFLLCAVLQTSVLFGAIWLSCRSEFDCTVFLPTFSYLAAYRGYDRLFAVAYTFYALVLLLFFLTAHMAYRGHAGGCVQGMMMTFGVIACLVLPGIAVIDEMGSSYLLPLDMVHKGLVALFCFSAFIWISGSFCGIFRLRRTLKGAFQTEQRLLVQYISIALLATFISAYIWYCQYYNAVNWLITDTTAALAEWFAVLTAVFLPYCYAISFPGLELQVALHSKAEKREN